MSCLVSITDAAMFLCNLYALKCIPARYLPERTVKYTKHVSQAMMRMEPLIGTSRPPWGITRLNCVYTATYEVWIEV